MPELPRPQERIEILGFDLGHGDSVIAHVLAIESDHAQKNCPQPEPLKVFGHPVNPTVIGRSKMSGKAYYGRGAVDRKNSEPRDLSVGIKISPLKPEWDTLGPLLLDFAAACYKDLRDGNKLRPDVERRMFLGCPSGWSRNEDAEAKLYERNLREAIHDDMLTLTVVPESRAAFIYARDVLKIRKEELAGAVVLIDIGSSTTDLTLVKDFQSKPFDYGYDLGGGLIDEQICRAVASRAACRAEIERHLEKKDDTYSRCLWACRKAKCEPTAHRRAFSDRSS
jgi:molecular chaperone DnaK (HSP70)